MTPGSFLHEYAADAFDALLNATLLCECRRVFVRGWRPGPEAAAPRADVSLYVPLADSPSTFDDLADVVDYEAVYHILHLHPFVAAREYSRAVAAHLMKDPRIAAVRIAIHLPFVAPVDSYFLRDADSAFATAATRTVP
ncbi:hypothetical protein B0G76_8516 [Paraburkholderia sp. BL23I1N1]|uniref:hypothetical protein n=1 Tax=unclassified Paraburkholderia TaxID=2615204 RepID=UPI000E737340|nr:MULTISPECIES: hypothetical protein [unclassified Paraburkholderia]RKE23828.1 hypothetical protein B0G76_8516 [Paraburkholderia sp. BL23I1N1]TDY15617.1 hypothetical protein B0G81_8693 [Paraburkholderia sp. BL6665CI2N2]